MTEQINRLLAIMARLRGPAGCEWDRAQNFATIAPYTIEEAYEVADAIERGDMDELRGELGDLLLQVVFHARIAEEAGHFDFSAVAEAISNKMEARHPHIFGQAETSPGWESLKATERFRKGVQGALDGVATALPALLRAEKLQRRAAQSGFDWPDPSGPAAKIVEEINELAEAPDDKRAEEAGDLLFAAVNVVRAYGIAPEDALRTANLKFERRFREMEALAGGHEAFATLSLDDQEALWQRVKAGES
jgi:ATP diphosphatase